MTPPPDPLDTLLRDGLAHLPQAEHNPAFVQRVLAATAMTPQVRVVAEGPRWQTLLTERLAPLFLGLAAGLVLLLVVQHNTARAATSGRSAVSYMLQPSLWPFGAQR